MVLLKVKAGGYSFEAANARHEHEWQVWEEVKLPEGKVIIPGVVTLSSVLLSIPSGSRTASSGSRTWSAARTSSPLPTAGSPAVRPRPKSIRDRGLGQVRLPDRRRASRQPAALARAESCLRPYRRPSDRALTKSGRKLVRNWMCGVLTTVRGHDGHGRENRRLPQQTHHPDRASRCGKRHGCDVAYRVAQELVTG